MFEFILNSAELGELVLRNDPIGWDKNLLTIKEDSKYQTVTRSIVVKLEFIKEGKQYIQQIYEEYGIEGYVTLKINEWNPQAHRYDFLHEGRVSLATYSVTKTGVECNIEELGFVQAFKNNDEVPVNLISREALDGRLLPDFMPRVREVTMHSKMIVKRYVATVAEPYTIGVWYTSPHTEDEICAFPSMDFIETEELKGAHNYTGEFRPNSSDIYELINIEEDGTYDLKLDLYYRVLVWSLNIINDNNTKVSLWYQINDGPEVEVARPIQKWELRYPSFDYPEAVRPLQTTDRVYTNQTAKLRSVVNVRNLELLRGDRIKVFIRINKEKLEQVFWLVMLQGSRIEISGKTRADATPCKGVLIYDALERICQHLTGDHSPFYSEFFGRVDRGYATNGPGSNLFLTSGFLLRGFDIEDKGLTVNWKQALDNLTALYGVAPTFEYINGQQKVRVEHRRHRYQQKVLMELGDVANLRKKVHLDAYFNEIVVGCTKWENEEVNVLDEFNATRNYTLPITQHKQKLDLTLTYITAGYDLEITRRLRSESTTDYKRDNDIYLVQLIDEMGELVPERDHRFTTFSGVIDPSTSYNVALSPARMLRSHGAVIRAGLEKYRDKRIKFAFGEANYKMMCKGDYEPALVDEGADIRNSSLEAPYFLPEVYEFDAPLSREQIVKLMSDVNGVIGFTDKGKMKYGYIISIKADRFTASEFQLLRANM